MILLVKIKTFIMPKIYLKKLIWLKLRNLYHRNELLLF